MNGSTSTLTRFLLRAPLFGLLVLALAFAGCGGSSDSGGDALSGSIRVDGSSTTFPLTEAVAEEFRRVAPEVNVTVGESGTGGGFSKFLRGETDINDASRPITEGEREQARERNVEYIELPVAYDGIAVVAHPEVDWVDCLSVDELRRIWAPNSSIDSWSQVRDGFPDVPLELYGPGTASGTYDYFTEAVVGEGGASRADFTASEDDNVLVQGVEGTQGSLGYFGFAYYTNNADRLKLISIDPDSMTGGAECTAPTPETIQKGSYRPLSRPLFMYVRAEAAARPEVQRFIDFYLDNASTLATDVGYVGLSDAAYTLAQNRFDDRQTGTVFGAEGAEGGMQVERLLRDAATPSDAMPAPDTTATDTTTAPAASE